MTKPPRLYPRTDVPFLFAILPLYVEEFRLVNDDPVHANILDLLLLYLYQLFYLGTFFSHL